MRKKQKRSPLHKIVIFAVALLFLFGGYYFGNRLGTDSAGFRILLTEPQLSVVAVPELINHNNKGFSANALKGHWSLVFLGNLDDSSDTKTLLTLSTQVRNRLASHPDLQKQFQVILISLSKTDTPEKLKTLISGYGKSFIGISGSLENVAKLTDQLGLKYSLVKVDGKNLFRSSSLMVLIDPEARINGAFAGKVTPIDMADDIVLASEKFQSNH
jgi:cytochrome oxidase Cu insertion factor (SCO1/SenC/PrrC family)